MTIEEINAVDALAAVEAGAFLLDVRNDDEWEAGRAPSAYYITLSEVIVRAAELPGDIDIIAVCRAGARSLKAAEALATKGYVVKNLTGGMRAWEAAGLPVVDATGGAGTVI